jgi:sec-independent protein translocase protein TatA
MISKGLAGHIHPHGRLGAVQCFFDSPGGDGLQSLSKINSKRTDFRIVWRFRNGVTIMFGGRLGVPELLLILGIALILFGPSKLGDLGKGLGDAIRNFKGAMKDGEQAHGQPTPPAQPTQPTDKAS